MYFKPAFVAVFCAAIATASPLPETANPQPCLPGNSFTTGDCTSPAGRREAAANPPESVKAGEKTWWWPTQGWWPDPGTDGGADGYEPPIITVKRDGNTWWWPTQGWWPGQGTDGGADGYEPPIITVKRDSKDIDESSWPAEGDDGDGSYTSPTVTNTS